ncbi:fumarylacetoacetate hydrolase family protein [Pseudoteredinibacter isoporae]|uniref:2-keto-4-pentenoate hydratase/2-oxohepta-3-ene-1,7-dioic acid hydratase in catechol pathway n=1 Tax=Pseudoteredinibacter isoporae TaxID=570281 RepID=A0A7X0JRB8_9GAMM|nr:fumarylacetoacetate hydrolase family protein [Pseudoteredinibacter isoporae]MBB6519955.1 2-keto-4-pentenoate hydratase/2-oxohepta-3-ene-1,7-dioic acid hydratase in catechol pathway [Pseudoteredinibacter isoporae]
MAAEIMLDGQPFAPCVEKGVGKVVCVGRNYAAHAAELNNPIPEEPILFMKPPTAISRISPHFSIPGNRGECHIETEIAILIGAEIARATDFQANIAIAGIGIGLDLTLREVQSALKEKGLPWEKSKAFDGSCPVSGFISPSEDEDWAALELSMKRNHLVQQEGRSADMLNGILPLIGHITQHFTLMPGDIVLTGTPAGVGPIEPGDLLEFELKTKEQSIQLSSEVVARTF